MAYPNIMIVDREDNPIGGKQYLQSVEDGDIRRVVRVFVFNGEGKFLLQQRTDKIVFPLKWDCAAAGHVDEGDTYLNAAVRETEEEIGVSIAPEEFIEFTHYFKSMTANLNGKTYPNYQEWMKGYAVVHEGPFTTSEEEVEKLEWVSMEELEKRIQESPESFMSAFPMCFEKFLENKKTA